jgi:hypothetical protein
VANDSDKIWGFVLLKSEAQIGLGKILSNEDGVNTTSFVQALMDFGTHCTITVKDIYGRRIYDWSVIFSKEINRRRMKVVIRKLLAEVKESKNYEMFVIGGTEKDPNGINSAMRVALDIDDSTQNCKYKIREALKRWSLVENYNYRAPQNIKYEQFRKDYRKVLKHIRIKSRKISNQKF